MDPMAAIPEPGSLDPLEVALLHLRASHRSLEGLITSSESFNYFQAKTALIQLQKDIQAVSQTKAAFEQLKRLRHDNIRVVDFSAGCVEAPVNG
jgi:hypothetical protein